MTTTTTIGSVIPFGYQPKDSMDILEDLMKDINTYLVDIRMMPFSKFRPEYNKQALAKHFGKRYLWLGESLGNIHYNDGLPIELANPDKGLPRLIDGLQQGFSLILLCGCRDYEECHRCTVVSELLKGIPNLKVIQPTMNIIPKDTKYCISIMQPYYWIIMNGNILEQHEIPRKQEENRSWKPSPDIHLPHDILLRAGSFDGDFYERGKLSLDTIYLLSRLLGRDVAERLYHLMPKTKDEYLSGGIAGRCTLVDVLDKEVHGGWKIPGQYGLVLEDIEPLPFLKTPGQFKMFSVPVCHYCDTPVNAETSLFVGDHRACHECSSVQFEV